MSLRWLSSALIISGLFAGCTGRQDSARIQKLENEIQVLKKNLDEQKPGLGEIMTTIHLHHAKLYYAGKNRNWDLANYELDELKEGLAQATGLHQHIDGVNASLKDLKHIVDPELAALEEAIHEKSETQFKSGFQHLTESCNACHKSAGHSFVVVQIPTAPMFFNQKF